MMRNRPRDLGKDETGTRQLGQALIFKVCYYLSKSEAIAARQVWRYDGQMLAREGVNTEFQFISW